MNFKKVVAVPEPLCMLQTQIVSTRLYLKEIFFGPIQVDLQFFIGRVRVDLQPVPDFIPPSVVKPVVVREEDDDRESGPKPQEKITNNEGQHNKLLAQPKYPPLHFLQYAVNLGKDRFQLVSETLKLLEGKRPPKLVQDFCREVASYQQLTQKQTQISQSTLQAKVLATSIANLLTNNIAMFFLPESECESTTKQISQQLTTSGIKPSNSRQLTTQFQNACWVLSRLPDCYNELHQQIQIQIQNSCLTQLPPLTNNNIFKDQLPTTEEITNVISKRLGISSSEQTTPFVQWLSSLQPSQLTDNATQFALLTKILDIMTASIEQFVLFVKSNDQKEFNTDKIKAISLQVRELQNTFLISLPATYDWKKEIRHSLQQKNPQSLEQLPIQQLKQIAQKEIQQIRQYQEPKKSEPQPNKDENSHPKTQITTNQINTQPQELKQALVQPQRAQVRKDFFSGNEKPLNQPTTSPQQLLQPVQMPMVPVKEEPTIQQQANNPLTRNKNQETSPDNTWLNQPLSQLKAAEPFSDLLHKLPQIYQLLGITTKEPSEKDLIKKFTKLTYMAFFKANLGWSGLTSSVIDLLNSKNELLFAKGVELAGSVENYERWYISETTGFRTVYNLLNKNPANKEAKMVAAKLQPFAK